MTASVRPRRRSRRTPEQSKAILVRAARQLFAQHGFHGTRTEAIARAAGLNKAMINYYYGGKRELYSAVLHEDITAAQQHITRRLSQGGTSWERLQEFITALAEFGEENPAFAFILVREQMSGSFNLDANVRRLFFGFFQYSNAILSAGMRRGEFRSVDTHAIHLSIIGSLVYFALTAPARDTYMKSGEAPSDHAPDAASYLKELCELYRRGLSATPAGSSPPEPSPLRELGPGSEPPPALP